MTTQLWHAQPIQHIWVIPRQQPSTLSAVQNRLLELVLLSPHLHHLIVSELCVSRLIEITNVHGRLPQRIGQGLDGVQVRDAHVRHHVHREQAMKYLCQVIPAPQKADERLTAFHRKLGALIKIPAHSRNRVLRHSAELV